MGLLQRKSLRPSQWNVDSSYLPWTVHILAGASKGGDNDSHDSDVPTAPSKSRTSGTPTKELDLDGNRAPARNAQANGSAGSNGANTTSARQPQPQNVAPAPSAGRTAGMIISGVSAVANSLVNQYAPPEARAVVGPLFSAMGSIAAAASGGS